jgi:hypothetical protein
LTGKDRQPLEVLTVPFQVLGLLTGGPYSDRAIDGRAVLMRGPRLSETWPTPTPAEAEAYRMGRPEIILSVRDCLRVAEGGVLDTETHLGEPARVRLATAEELMADQRRALAELGGDQPEPMTRERAAEMVEPVVVPEGERRQFLALYGDLDEPSETRGDTDVSKDDTADRDITINGNMRVTGPLKLVLPDGRRITLYASGTVTVQDAVVDLAEYQLDLPSVLDVANRCAELDNDRGGMGSGEVPITVYHKH